MRDTGDDELLGDVVSEVIVRSEDYGAVVVMTFDEVVERVEFLLGCPGESFGSLLGNECPPSLWI